MICANFKAKYPNCCDCSTNKVINAAENSRKYSFDNKTSQLICKIKIDNCVLSSDKDEKCDYLFVRCPDDKHTKTESIAYFVELKGKDLIKACRQISETIKNLPFPIKDFNQVNARIVLSKAQTPDLNSTELIRFRKEIKKLGGNVLYGTKVFNETAC